MKYKMRKVRDNLELETKVREMHLVVRKVFRKEEREKPHACEGENRLITGHGTRIKDTF